MSVHNHGASGTPPPSRCGNYILGERLASGGMAEVFHAEAVERRFDKPIVLKRMLPHLADNRRFVEMFIDEARLSTRLDHPNIVQVLDFEATERGLFLVMELVDGPDLLSIIKRCLERGKNMPRELAAYVACHVLEALDYAHGASANGKRLDVVHRDVSPSNILITRRGHVKLADFGIARASERQQETAKGTLKGKFGYMSPEQVQGLELDGRSDVFSLGIVLAEMLMGRRLFIAPGDLETLLMVRRGDLSRLDKYGQDIPPALMTVLRRALEPDRAKRFATAGAFRDELVEWLASAERRTGAGQLAKLIAELESDGKPLGVRGPLSGAAGSRTTLSGPETRLARVKIAKAAVAGRQVFARGSSPGNSATSPTAVIEDFGLAPFEGASQPGVELPSQVAVAAPRPRPRASSIADELDLRAGLLEQLPAIEILCEIARRRLTGILVVKSGELVKEAYFAHGHPVFVRSNVGSERFGQYLVRRRVLTVDQLDRALAALPHFDGRLGQALVSLGLLQPVDAVRLLADQVAFKLADVCRWTRGKFFFREHVRCPWPALELRLNTLAVVGRCLELVPRERLAEWGKKYRDRRPAIDLDAATELGLDPALAERLRTVSAGQLTLADAMRRLPTAADRRTFAAAAYLLWRCSILTMPHRRQDSVVEADAVPETGERRRYPRVEMHLAGTIERKNREEGDPDLIRATITSATCEGLGLAVDEDLRAGLRRRELVVLRFLAGVKRMELTGRVAWTDSRPDDDFNVGVVLEPALCTAAMRESYATWVIALLDDRTN